ncbi:MAG: hypothetical protein QM730_00390 [Anaerolineales bacterium]
MRKQTYLLILTVTLFSMACGMMSSLPQIGSSTPVQVTTDASHTATATIGAEGGTIRATAADGTMYELVIPPDALDFNEAISMTPVSAVDGLPLSGGLIGAVTLEPAGIIFYEPATLLITPATTNSGELSLGFAYDGTGEEFHLQRVLGNATTTGLLPDSPFVLNATLPLLKNASSPTLKLTVPSTRGYGAGSGTAKDVANRQKATPRPQDPMDHIDELLIDPTAIALPKFVEEMSNTLNNGILPLLKAAQADPKLADKALLLYDRWVAVVDEYGLKDELMDDRAKATVALLDLMDKLADYSAERCYTQKRPEEAFALQRWVRYARKFLPNAPQIEDLQTRISKCLTFKVKFHSVITEQGGGYGYSYELNSELTLRAKKSMYATGSAPLVYSDGHWIGNDGCGFKLEGESSEFDAEWDTLGLLITPVSRTSPAVNVTFRYDPGIPVEQTTMSCPDVNPIHWTTTAWQTYFSEMHAEEQKGVGYEISSQITGAGTFTGWVFNNTTTGPGGQAVEENTQIDITHTPSK